MTNSGAKTDWNLLWNFTRRQESVKIVDCKTEDLWRTSFLFTDLQHPAGHLPPHVGLQLGLECEVVLGGGVGQPHLPLEQHPQHPVVAEDVRIAVGPDRSQHPCGLHGDQTRLVWWIHCNSAAVRYICIMPCYSNMLQSHVCSSKFSTRLRSCQSVRAGQYSWPMPSHAGLVRPDQSWSFVTATVLFITIFNARNINENMIMFLFQTYGLLTLIRR